MVRCMSSLVAVRQRREQVIAELSECYQRDLLDVDELDRLLDQAHAATSLAELDALVAGLAPHPSTSLVVHTPTAIDDPNRVAQKRLGILFGSVDRTGHWVVPKTLVTRILFGNAALDFRDASMGAGVTTLDVSVTFGNLELILPPWLSIDVDVSSLAGSVEERHRVAARPDPSQPVLMVTGAVRFGNLEISTRLPGETRGDARRREKRERNRLRQAHKALPPGRGQM